MKSGPLKRTEIKRRTSFHVDERGQGELFARRHYKPIACEACTREFVPTGSRQRKCPSCRNPRKPKPCATCGISFTPPNRANQKYCSMTCSRWGHVVERVCPVCNTTFTRPRERRVQTCCSFKCREIHKGKKRLPDDAVTSQRWSLKLKGATHCRNCGALARHLHHIVPRSKARAVRIDYERNGLPLCIDCHNGWHNRSVTILHAVLTDAEFACAVEHGGALWVERNYPDPGDIALMRLDEIVNRRVLRPNRPETIDERMERILVERDRPPAPLVLIVDEERDAA
jgi:hypothetical protein